LRVSLFVLAALLRLDFSAELFLLLTLMLVLYRLVLRAARLAGHQFQIADLRFQIVIWDLQSEIATGTEPWLTRRQRASLGHLFVEPNSLRVPWQLSN
jgi:hypothetical protein